MMQQADQSAAEKFKERGQMMHQAKYADEKLEECGQRMQQAGQSAGERFEDAAGGTACGQQVRGARPEDASGEHSLTMW